MEKWKERNAKIIIWPDRKIEIRKDKIKFKSFYRQKYLLGILEVKIQAAKLCVGHPSF